MGTEAIGQNRQIKRRTTVHRAPTRVTGVSARLIAILALAALPGCSNDQLLKNDTSLSGATKTGASAYQTAQPKGSSSGFNPFGDSPDQSLQKRVVLQNPTIEQVLEPSGLPEMSLGRKDAPVTVIKYASMTCPYCRKFHAEVFPKLKRNYIDTGKIRFILREFPIGRSSGNATIALRCAPQSKYFTLYGKFMEQQKSWVSQTVRLDAIHKVASQVGLSRAKFDACLKNQGMIDGLKKVKDRGRTLGIIGTPNFFIQNQLVKSVLTYDDLAARIDALLKAPVAPGAPVASTTP